MFLFVDFGLFLCGEYITLLRVLEQWVFEDIKYSYGEVLFMANYRFDESVLGSKFYSNVFYFKKKNIICIWRCETSCEHMKHPASIWKDVKIMQEHYSKIIIRFID